MHHLGVGTLLAKQSGQALADKGIGLVREDDGIGLADLGSKNGVVVQGLRVSGAIVPDVAIYLRAVESMRRLVVNAVLWALRRPVRALGVPGGAPRTGRTWGFARCGESACRASRGRRDFADTT